MLSDAILGAVVPLTLNRLQVDPAIATGPFVTTGIDMFAILIYFFHHNLYQRSEIIQILLILFILFDLHFNQSSRTLPSSALTVFFELLASGLHPSLRFICYLIWKFFDRGGRYGKFAKK